MDLETALCPQGGRLHFVGFTRHAFARLEKYLATAPLESEDNDDEEDLDDDEGDEGEE